MVGIRFFISQFSSNSGLNDSMLAMTIAMPFMSAVTSLYNRRKQSKDYKQSVSEWKEKYENYINETIIKKKIVKWQKDEIVYLNKAYPRMCTLFNQTGEISTAIFARSQNDNDFMRVTLGESDEIKPSFQIKAEQKMTYFMMCVISSILPRKVKMSVHILRSKYHRNIKIKKDINKQQKK